MPYSRTNWVESETPLSADNMNNIENGIEEALAGLNENSLKAKLLNAFYPVGSYYETSDSSFNPNASFGGTWVKEDPGQVHVSAGTGYAPGTTGGSKTHTHTTGDFTLGVNHIPAHTHGKSGAVSGGITGGSHSHGMKSVWSDGVGSGSAYMLSSNRKPATRTTDSATHTHNLPAHEHSSVGGGQKHNHGNTGNASNMPPYVAVSRWHRIA